MATILDALVVAAVHHRSGRLREAEAIYRQVLKAEPGHAQAWYQLGRLAFDAGNEQLAMESLVRAAELAPHVPEYEYALGLFLEAHGNLTAR